MESNRVSKPKGSNVFFKIFIAVLLFSIAAAGTVGVLAYNDYKKMEKVVESDTIYNNVYLENINIGGLTKEEAIAKLEDEVQKPLNEKEITLKNADSEYKFKYNQFGVKFDLSVSVDEAFDYARTGTVKERYNLITALETSPKYIETTYEYDKELVKKEVTALEDKIYVAPVNASAKRENGKFIVQEGKNGKKLNIETTITSVYELLDSNKEGDIAVTTEEVEPKYKTSDFQKMDTVIGEYSTNYSGGGGRVTNMQVAASKINGTIVYPGEVFSTNACFGPSTYENGYKPAPTIVGGKLVDDLGGGVCQVSSTLYDAILYSELAVVERQNHSIKVGYSDYGYDATLAGDYIDFKFKNSLDVPIYLESLLTDNKVIVKVYGNETRPKNRKIAFENALIEKVAPPAETITYDSSMKEGQRKTTVTALNGYRYKLYKLVYVDDKLTEKIEVNTSYYRPRRAEVVVGQKKASVANNDATEKKPETTQKTENITPVTEAPKQEAPEPKAPEPEVNNNEAPVMP